MSYLWMFLIMYFISFVLVLSLDDWFMVWLSLEINMMMFISLIYKQNSVQHTESCLSYFFIQSLGSMIIMMSFYMYSDFLDYFMCLALSLKLGAGPVFFWFPSVCQGIGWVSCFALMTLQKFIPLVMLIPMSSWMLWMLILVSLVVGVIGSLNQIDMKILFAYSSIHHVGWMMMCNEVNSKLWMIYLLLYGLMIGIPIYIMWSYDIMSMMMMGKLNVMWFMVLSMMSMAGLPPMMGFFLKYFAFYYIIEMEMLVVMIMVIMSVFMFYIYIRVVYDIIMGVVSKVSWISFLGKWKVSMDVVGVMGMVVGLYIFILLWWNSMKSINFQG